MSKSLFVLNFPVWDFNFKFQELFAKGKQCLSSKAINFILVSSYK